MSDEPTLESAIEFGSDRAAEEAETIDGTIPDHAAQLLSYRAAMLLQNVTQFDIMDAREDTEDVSEDERKDVIEEAAVDVLLALGALDHEYDLRITDAFERRMSFVEDVEAYEEAIADAETEEDYVDAFDEHLAEHHDDEVLDLDSSVEVGDSVDRTDYEHDDEDKGYQ